MDKRFSIVSLGEVLWDLFPEGARFGGAPANFACHAAATGIDVFMVSAVGEDARGRDAIKILRAYNIDVTLIQSVPDAPTGTVGVSLDAKGKPTFTIHEGSAWDRIAWTRELEARITGTDAVYFGTLGQRSGVSRTTIRRALDVAKASGKIRILDVNLRSPFYDNAMIRESVQNASILKLSDDELDEVCRACEIDSASTVQEKLRAMLGGFCLDLVVMTRGADGALLVSTDESVDQPGIPVEVRDTVGAGDAFTAALVTGLLRGESVGTIARSACKTAAAVCTQLGAVPELPADPKATDN
jgi:fructokinase